MIASLGMARQGTTARDWAAIVSCSCWSFSGLSLRLRAATCRLSVYLRSVSRKASAIPTILSGQDLVIGAETGSGKTLAYLLPIVERLLRGLAKAEGLPDELLGENRRRCTERDFERNALLIVARKPWCLTKEPRDRQMRRQLDPRYPLNLVTPRFMSPRCRIMYRFT